MRNKTKCFHDLTYDNRRSMASTLLVSIAIAAVSFSSCISELEPLA